MVSFPALLAAIVNVFAMLKHVGMKPEGIGLLWMLIYVAVQLRMFRKVGVIVDQPQISCSVSGLRQDGDRDNHRSLRRPSGAHGSGY
jgi:hypothetical protein